MATIVEVFVGLSWFVNLILDGCAAYYCYKVTKITGGFAAWWLVIAFTVVFAVSSFTSVSYSVVISEAMGALATSNASLTVTAFTDVVLYLVMSALLFTAMFQLQRTFKRIQSGNSRLQTPENAQ